ncbi:MoaB/Mog domain-containing protein [Lipomyces tetrasporus]|uniref:MoaB/Mog domain-containing protein n=1 Tax=Lipomyces tetrasporus TaxID=54092 RepID=A0AAD7VPL0_9ASCO|nr:MoaB/Mog domain-containing protein [Lipomyces tetrasporus]KAJ8096564.1 MoaB/Mog domain-containing protein [Lipomyces tetrasporus]
MRMRRFTQLFAPSLPLARRPMATHALSTAACLIIGDEVLNGKIRDANSYTFAKFCFEIGLDLKRVEVIGDEEHEIVEAAQRMAKEYDFIVTSGGIGPTHDDITYQSIAKAFDLPLVLHEETVKRMQRLGIRRLDPNDNEAINAQMRMATLPKGTPATEAEVIYSLENSWVPVVRVASKIHILPGIPQLFNGLLFGLRKIILPNIPPSQRKHRLLVTTYKAESEMASFLTQLQERVKDREIKIGSYPHMVGINTVSIIGKEEYLDYMKELVKETEEALEGKAISIEDEAKLSSK